MYRKVATMLTVVGLCTVLAIPAAQAGGSQAFAQEQAGSAATQQKAGVNQGNLLSAAHGQGNLTVFLKAIDAAGMKDVLARGGPYTIFAPTDDAFAKLPAGTVEALLKDQAKLKALLAYHVVPKVKYGFDLRRDALRTMAGPVLQVSQYSSQQDLRVNDTVEIVQADINASNGVIHTIDSVLQPRS